MLRYFTIASKRIQKFNYFTLSSKNFSRYFTKDHEWLSVEKGVATVGITDHAQSELGEIVHVDLPKVGDKFKLGESLGAIESVKTAADVFSPIEGVVMEVNEKLAKNPELLNSHPESQGWYAKMKVDEEKIKPEQEGMMNEEQYAKYVEEVKH